MNAPHIVDYQMESERVKYYLGIWKEWMHRPGLSIGYPKQSLMMANGGIVDFEDLVEAADNTAARAMDAIIDGLSPSQQQAVQHFNGIAVWTFKRLDIREIYMTALDEIERGLNRKGLA